MTITRNGTWYLDDEKHPQVAIEHTVPDRLDDFAKLGEQLAKQERIEAAAELRRMAKARRRAAKTLRRKRKKVP